MRSSFASRLAAASSAVIAVVYLLIGVNAIIVIDGQGPELGVPPLVASALFAGLVALVLLVPRRGAFVAGALLQVFMIGMYFLVAVERTPPFEAWGIGLKVAQAVLLVLFVGLAVRHPGRNATSSGDDQSQPREHAIVKA